MFGARETMRRGVSPGVKTVPASSRTTRSWPSAMDDPVVTNDSVVVDNLVDSVAKGSLVVADDPVGAADSVVKDNLVVADRAAATASARAIKGRMRVSSTPII
jgi:hypothetical protein